MIWLSVFGIAEQTVLAVGKKETSDCDDEESGEWGDNFGVPC